MNAGRTPLVYRVIIEKKYMKSARKRETAKTVAEEVAAYYGGELLKRCREEARLEFEIRYVSINF
jgi:hypothetical protein